MIRFCTALLLLSCAVLPAWGQSIDDLGARDIAVSPSPAKQGESIWTSETFADGATGVVVRGRSSNRNLKGWVRFNGSDEWRELFVVFSVTGDNFLGGYHGEDVFTGGFELRLDAPAELDGVGYFDNRDDVDRQSGERSDRAPADDGERSDRAPADDRERSDEPGDPDQSDRVAESIGRSEASSTISPPTLRYRGEWDADPFRGDPVPLARPNYLYLTFHHAAGFGAHTEEEGLEQVKAIQTFHQNGRGWSDIGYQFLMDQSGRMYQGRPFLNGNVSLSSAPDLVMGAHVGGYNTGNIGICALGCYHPPAGSYCEDVLSEPAMDSLAVMLAFLSENYAVPPDRIRGHRDFSSTACPGDNNYVLMDELRARTQELLVVGNEPIGAARLSAQLDEDGVVHISWEFLEDRGIAGFRIEREQADSTVVIYERSGALPDEIVDEAVGLPGPVVYRLYARSSDGREQLLAVAEAVVGAPQEYVLTESFPNPFARATTIRYYLPQDGIVRLAVYDVIGREVGVLVDRSQEGGRWYHAEFDASGLPAGTYFYRLEVEGFSGTAFKESRSLIRVR